MSAYPIYHTCYCSNTHGQKMDVGGVGVVVVCCLLRVTVNDTHVSLPIHLTRAALIKKKGLRNKLHSVI